MINDFLAKFENIDAARRFLEALETVKDLLEDDWLIENNMQDDVLCEALEFLETLWTKKEIGTIKDEKG